MNSQKILTTFQKYFPTGGAFPPALTIGLAIFLFAFYVISLAYPALPESLSLYPGAIFHLDMNRVSLYPLCHKSFFHYLMNILALLTPLSYFERKFGTVHTGVVLNLFAVTTAIPFSILGMLVYPNTHVIGASGWAFSFMAYYAHQESKIKPVYQLTSTISVPTIYSPFILLIIMAILVPGSSFFGHLFGISSGFLLSFGYLNILIPPSKVIVFIEAKLNRLINLIPGFVDYYRETDALATRSVGYTSMFEGDLEASVPSAVPFSGQGHVLGA